VQAPSDRTLAPIGRAGRCRTGWFFDDRRLDQESVARPLSARKLLKLLELGRSNCSSSKFGLSLATDAKTRNAANDKKQIAIDLKIAFHYLIVVSSRMLNR
jgi:hypothetical protein